VVVGSAAQRPARLTEPSAGTDASGTDGAFGLAASARTHRGRVRRGNEDAYLCRPPLFAVADGLGGLAAGEVASRLAIDALSSTQTPPGSTSDLVELLRSADRSIRRAAEDDITLAGMGTTCTALLVRSGRAEIAHVGDTRAYALRDARLSLLTRDHSLAQELVRVGRLTADEAVAHVSRNTLTRALGAPGELEVDSISWPLAAGDRLLLASDGLTGMVDDAALVALLAPGTTANAADRLVRAALDAGGLDNVTVVVIDIAALPSMT
jgi:serine/threonine protein phosphatase PrpC